MSTIPGLFVLGEANFSDHEANRLEASALMQGLADGYFIIPYTVDGYLAGVKPGEVSAEDKAFTDAAAEVTAKVDRLLSINGNRTVDDFHRELGQIIENTAG
jgi:succinate dehydrogenase / fumarate reductase flavoprotein subunit